MKLLLILFSIFVFGCADRHISYSGISKVEASGNFAGSSLDSIIKSYRDSISSLEKLIQNTEIKFTTIEYSNPDSLGNQYKVKETIGTIKQEINQEKETQSNSNSDVISITKKDSLSSTEVSQQTEESFSEEKKVSTFRKVIISVIVFSVIGLVIYLLWPKIRKVW